MKINRFEIKNITFEEFAEEHNLTLIVHKWNKSDGFFYLVYFAQSIEINNLEGLSVKDYGCGNTEELAIKDYARKFSGNLITFYPRDEDNKHKTYAPFFE